MTGNDRIKLEDLLRLKRAERPSEADWERFDKELKNKLYFQIVRKPSAAERIFSGRAVKFGAVFSAIILGESDQLLNYFTLLAIVLVCLGIFIINKFGEKNKKQT